MENTIVEIRKLLNHLGKKPVYEKELLYFDDMVFDLSRLHVTKEIEDLLYKMLNEIKMRQSIDSLLKGKSINFSESKKILHTALRSTHLLEDEEVKNFVKKTKQRMYKISDDIREESYRGITSKKIKNIVHIGIGGSHKGMELLYDIYKDKSDFKLYFLSNIDFIDVERILKKIKLDETIFIYCSKSGKTEEPYQNFLFFKNLFLEKLGKEGFEKHFYGVSSNKEKLLLLGLKEDNILELLEEVGGRFSIFSVVSLSIIICFGKDFFEDFLKGAEEADLHFLNEEWEGNIPIQLALCSWFYINFFNLNSICVLPYSSIFRNFIGYYQQLEMESNGKNVDKEGNKIDSRTTVPIWGDIGTNAQHSFFQYLHQTKDVILNEFIGVVNPLHSNKSFHDVLMSHFFSQMDILYLGKKEGKNKYSQIEGGKPVISILLDNMNPKTLGGLISFYENRIFVEGILHNINSFDQWAVNFGKYRAVKYRQEDMEVSPLSKEYKKRLNI